MEDLIIKVKSYWQNYSQRVYLKVHGGENEYSRIHYNATSLLIVMLSAHEIKVYPLNG